MPSPSTSASTSIFNLSGNPTIDPLLDETHMKWGGGVGTGVNLTFSFPWVNGDSAYFATYYSTKNEQSADEHFGFNAVQMDAVRNALESWANVANLNFTEVSDTSTNVGDFRFAFSSALPDDVWGWSGYPNNYLASAADVWVNSSHGYDADWSAGTYNYESLIHEIGHGLGLKHPGNYNGDGEGSPPFLSSTLDFRNYTIMSYNDPNNDYYWDSSKNISILVAPDTPMVYDIQAIQYLYGANTNYHTGNDTYTFYPDEPFYTTIWDAGGTDTIDISAFNLGSNINLRSGTYSTITFPTPAPDSSYFNGANDLGIAFNVVIENVIGSGGNDTIIVNNANNNLDGGAGIDTIFYNRGKSNFDIVKNSDGTYTVQDNTNLKDIDKLVNIERLSFTGNTPGDFADIALDIATPTKSAGAALALYYAGFNSLPDSKTFGHWIIKADQINSHTLFDKNNLEELGRAMITEYAPTGISNGMSQQLIASSYCLVYTCFQVKEISNEHNTDLQKIPRSKILHRAS